MIGERHGQLLSLTPGSRPRPGNGYRAGVRARRPIVPQTALLSDARGSYVLIVGPDDRAQRRAVKVGGTQPNGIVIADGLEGSERVVTTAAAFLHEGERVRVAAAKDAS